MINELHKIYNSIKPQIIERLEDFKQVWKNGNDYDIFIELVFCLLTPQSKAISCWKCVNILKEKNLLLNGNIDKLKKEIRGYARFHNVKAQRIIEARKLFMNNNAIHLKEQINNFKTTPDKRKWLVSNIKGYGYKEASHFLRNIGFGDGIAILDRHIYRNFKQLNIIDEIPKSVTPKKYFEIEKKMSEFSTNINISMIHLDFVLWYKETGKIFK